MKIIIEGDTMTGKTALAEVLAHALLPYGMEITFADDEGHTAEDRRPWRTSMEIVRTKVPAVTIVESTVRRKREEG